MMEREMKVYITPRLENAVRNLMVRGNDADRKEVIDAALDAYKDACTNCGENPIAVKGVIRDAQGYETPVQICEECRRASLPRGWSFIKAS